MDKLNNNIKHKTNNNNNLDLLKQKCKILETIKKSQINNFFGESIQFPKDHSSISNLNIIETKFGNCNYVYNSKNNGTRTV